MENEEEFVDYYDILKVNSDADARTLEVAYHYFAKLYHPDNPETADVEKFGAVVEAYTILRDPEKRSRYDEQYISIMGAPHVEFALGGDLEIDGDTAVGDAEVHFKILRRLYKKRRERASEAGIAGWLLQETLNCSDDEFDFHIWYLKSKGLIETTQQGTLAVTIEGVDHVIAASKTLKTQKLFIEQSGSSPERA